MHASKATPFARKKKVEGSGDSAYSDLSPLYRLGTVD